MEGLVIKAEKIARKAHKGQFRWNGSPYIVHPKAVAESFNEEEIDCRVVGWLHDVIEDCNYTAKKLNNLGIPKYLVDAVEFLTKVKEENYYDFIFRCALNPISKEVKIADIKNNLSDLKEGNLKDKYRFALHILENSHYGVITENRNLRNTPLEKGHPSENLGSGINSQQNESK